ncbi:hypothetical protein HLB44_00010 [Aquincola sp. S2]|uniref:SGNH hydrolase-type esterase domain-containing protein n=1 Tax=Pseudaquabacterium terrae TaxID=2732868 RepID=A0ABX2EC63_9BURK|nr:GDSL-type esterase/lipase family protein [Aquabacterium terrae]NRF65357.1 hypothetical protein [Aquabacterium terrae]
MSAVPVRFGMALGGAMCAAAGAALLDQSLRVRRALADARAAAAVHTAFERRIETAHARVLVLGDSTGAGIGAQAADEAIAGLLARDHPQIEVLNLSRSGARIADVGRQTESLPRSSQPLFDLLLLHVGANDILRARRLAEIDEPAQRMVCTLRPLARRMIWVGPGDLGLAPLFRAPFTWWLSRRTHAAARRFGRLAQHHDIHFVGFHEGPHRAVLAADPRRYFCADGIHPSTEGYRYCYGWLRSAAVLELGGAVRDQATGDTFDSGGDVSQMTRCPTAACSRSEIASPGLLNPA